MKFSFIFFKKIFSVIAVVLSVCVLFASVLPAWAEKFSPHEILSDRDLLNYKAISLNGIQKFLDEQPGILSEYRTDDIDEVEKSAAEIIYRASQDARINPQVILVILQKEQNLVTDPDPSEKQLDWAAGYAVCDDCRKDDPQLQKYKGFAKQVDYAAGSMRYYFDNPLQFKYQVNSPILIDGTEIIPKNQATVNLYIYTPHLSGNENFWKLWNQWFGRVYPDGSLLRLEGDDTVWLISEGKRRPFASKNALISRYDESKIIVVSSADLEKFEEGAAIKFANHSLLQSPRGNIYLLVDEELRMIESREVFMKIGFSVDEVIRVEWDEIYAYPRGAVINAQTAYPMGALLQDTESGGVFWVTDEKKHPIIAPEILKANFGKKTIIASSKDTLETYEDADPIRFRDGELIKARNNPTVYVISEGFRRPIANEDAFNALGYRWEHIIETSRRAVQLHELGDILE